MFPFVGYRYILTTLCQVLLSPGCVDDVVEATKETIQ